MKFRAISGLVVLALFVSTLHGDDKKGDVSLDGVTCALNLTRPAKDVEGSSVDFKGGKVFFCCANCPKAFAKGLKGDAADQLTAQGNWQLVATGQAVSTGKCPVAGRPINPKQKSTINGVEISFCCPGCKGKVDKAADAKEKINIIFGDEKKFDAAFKTPEEE